MDKTSHSSDPNEPFAGPSPAITALGYGQAYGIGGTIIGAIAGVVGSEGIARKFPSFLEKATKLMATLNIPDQGKNMIRVAGGIGGAVFGHYSGLIYGFFARGVPLSRLGQEQFERVRNERNAAITQVDMLEASYTKRLAADQTTHGSHSEQHASRAEHGSHAAAHAADKHAAESAEHTRS